ncbi:MAG: pyridoxamine 5'-phosphate oxidase family protein [Dehalococcoidales bacterium]|nr:pyridoxamine 5'-phosphate oxidase family protein [Dehalococcoidales bacterium]
MAKLTPQMKEFIEKGLEPTIVFVGTATKTGVPNVAAKGSFIHIVDDETLAFADVYSGKTIDNVRQNPRVAITMVNSKTYKGYQFKGRGEIVESGPLLEEAKKQNPSSKTVTKIKVEEVYLMDYGPKAGERVA